MNTLARHFRDAALIALIALLLGLSLNQRLVRDAFTGQLGTALTSAGQSTGSLPQPVLLAEVRELLAAGALAVDARDGALYAEGRLPGARLLPLGEVDQQLEGFRAEVPVARPLVLYCNGYGCADSFDLGLLLITAGYTDVRVFEGGFPEWRDAGLPVEKGQP